jgi:tetratricopeptide (TPR) repeat protein
MIIGVNMKKIFFISIIFFVFLSSCTTLKTAKVDKNTWDFEKYILESFKLTNSGEYQKAINLLKEAVEKYKDDDIILINYNIGFNLYKMKKFDDAKGYFTTVINLYDTADLSESQKLEDKKFKILSNSLIDKMEIDKADTKDPYHVQEDIDKNKKIQPQKKDAVK